MQSPRWYGKFISNDPGMTIDNNNKYIGIARLRQHRSDNHSCVVQPRMSFLTKHCISPYTDGPEFGDFSEGWGNSRESDKFARMDSVWKYQPPQITGTFSYFGEFEIYPGGGYVTTLGRNWRNSLLNIQYIYRNNWIDRYTRCLFIEFLMYSPNSNLFQSVTVILELGSSGYYITKYNVRTASLLFVKNKSGSWASNIACLICTNETTLTILASSLIFLATLRLWKLLRFLLIIKVVEKTLRLFFPQIYFAVFYQTVFIFLFQLFDKLLFEDQMNNEDSFMTFILLGLCFLKKFDFQIVRTSAQRAYYSFYMMASLFLLTYYIAVLTICYGESQIFYSNQQGYTVFDYLYEQYHYYKGVIAIKMKILRQRGGQDDTTPIAEKPVFAKAKKYRFAKCLKMPRRK
ncbi:hypothetical protein JTB14_020375 [Gonioctena quinquepunctata]|nr:hypothetical protein JTB14_020375 [Gonioctena quinquepunctata]